MASIDWSQYAVSGAQRPDSFSGMDNVFQTALANMIQNAPPGVRDQLRVSSGYRSVQRQKELWNQALAKYGSPEVARRWVAPPGNSQHNKGRAADLRYLSPDANSWVKENAAQYGLAFPLANEPWHVELGTARGKPKATVAGMLGFALTPDNAPTPSTRPPDLESILSAPAPTNSLLNAPVTSVQRAALKEPSTVAAFDNGRFAGPQVNMQTVPELSYDRFSTQPFDAARFGPVTETGKTTNQLRRALLDQQLDAGVLPNLSNPAYAAMAPSSATVRAPSTIANASVQAPAAPMNSLLSPQEENAVAAQRNYLSSLPLNKPTISPDRIKSVLGTVGPAIAGGLLGGPLGALAGGFIGKQIFSNNILTPPEERMPEAPKSQSRGDGSLTSYGRSVANNSSQFGRALASGGKGLY